MNNIVDYEYLFWTNKIVHEAINEAHQNHDLIDHIFKCYKLWHLKDYEIVRIALLFKNSTKPRYFTKFLIRILLHMKWLLNRNLPFMTTEQACHNMFRMHEYYHCIFTYAYVIIRIADHTSIGPFHFGRCPCCYICHDACNIPNHTNMKNTTFEEQWLHIQYTHKMIIDNTICHPHMRTRRHTVQNMIHEIGRVFISHYIQMLHKSYSSIVNTEIDMKYKRNMKIHYNMELEYIGKMFMTHASLKCFNIKDLNVSK